MHLPFDDVRDSSFASSNVIWNKQQSKCTWTESGPKDVPRPNGSDVGPERSRTWTCTNASFTFFALLFYNVNWRESNWGEFNVLFDNITDHFIAASFKAINCTGTVNQICQETRRLAIKLMRQKCAKYLLLDLLLNLSQQMALVHLQQLFIWVHI